MKSTRFLLALSLLSCCSVRTKIATYPRDYEVEINGWSYGRSPASIVLRNRTFGNYNLVLRDAAGNAVFQEALPVRFNGGGLFWPPLVGFFTNLFKALPEYEIDVAAVTALDGLPKHRPSDERPDPALWPRRRGLKVWADRGFQLMDEGWISLARPWFDRCQRADPSYPDPLLGLAIYCRQKGENEQAQAWLEKYRQARETFESYPPPRRAVTSRNLSPQAEP
jgi:hypothetical protein